MQDHNATSLGDILTRIFWMLLGPLLLAMFAHLIITLGNGWFTGADFGFLAVLAGMMLARWLEFRGGHPQTADGQPATPGHLRRFLLGVAVIGFTLWVIANILANYVLA
jgi:hypothetical protein